MTVTRRAYSSLVIKAVDEEKRIIRGIATTPTPDRVGDIVEPLGVKFSNPLAFLWQHDAHQPIGTVKFDTPTAEGITFEAEIPTIDEPGTLKDRIDEAWQSIKIGLVRAVSIGFRAIEYAWIDDGGIRFIKSEVFELSAVTIPAQPEAIMTSIKNMDATGVAVIKQFDANAPAATGTIERPAKKPAPGASGKSHKPVNLRPKEATEMKTIAEQIAALEASRQAKSARMAEVMQKSIDEGRSTDEAEQEEFDTLSDELDAIDGDLKRLRSLEKAQANNAKPVIANQIKTASQATALRSGVALKANEPDKGIRFARYAKCLAIATKTHQPIVSVAEGLYGKTDADLIDIVKAAVSAMTTSNTSELIGNEGGFADFVEFLRPMTVLGRFGTGNIPSLTRIPFRVPLISEASESDANWVGEGKAKPLTRMTAGRTELSPLKIATIAVQTMELIRDSSPSSDVLIRNSLAKAIAKREDLTFIDPTVAPTAGVRPGSILNGVAATTNSTATGADGVREDVQAIIQNFVTANNPLQSGVWIMGATYALRLMMMLNPLGQREFPGISMQGGTFFELPVIVSNYLGDYVALVNAEDVWFADDGGVEIAMSTEASLEMDSAPAHNSDTPTPAELVSMFQTNSVAFRAERTINWARRRASAVAWMDNITWGDPAPVTP
ncbi:phage major capsid protein [Aliihoeflea sp. 40Bstr573]|uniref:phage major capsid protein n=1 Tax=Aliihoeflea sp. 40Bstr573 TaxID=2696467 RepID=UPI002095D2B9|nr:phage major capsid protein [Aliihoeflea sp. 40Bstr573]MCO6386229.1 phage major capsid protein [Aliihoeflea sp. 40Bstr573]